MRNPPRILVLVFAFAATRAVAVGLSVLGYGRVRAALDRLSRPGPGRRPAIDGARVRARAIAGVVAEAARGVPRVGCLPRSLVTSALLAREGIETAVRIGVRRESGLLRAHAWVEHQGVPLGEPEDVTTRFAPFDRNFGGGAALAP